MAEPVARAAALVRKLRHLLCWLRGGQLLTDVAVPGLEEWDVTILGPEDTARFVAHFGEEPT